MTDDFKFPAMPEVNLPLMAQDMTLRDYFAAKALMGMAASDAHLMGWTISDIANRSYELADAMMKAREP